MDYSLPGSSICGILQARTLEWVALTSSRESSDLEIKPMSLSSPVLAGGFLTTIPHGKPHLLIHLLADIGLTKHFIQVFL